MDGRKSSGPPKGEERESADPIPLSLGSPTPLTTTKLAIALGTVCALLHLSLGRFRVQALHDGQPMPQPVPVRAAGWALGPHSLTRLRMGVPLVDAPGPNLFLLERLVSHLKPAISSQSTT